MLDVLCDDLNGAGVMGILFDHLNKLKENGPVLAEVKGFIQNVLGLTLELLPEKEMTITPEIQTLLEQRELARKAKDWGKADALREKLRLLGVDISDKKNC